MISRRTTRLVGCYIIIILFGLIVGGCGGTLTETPPKPEVQDGQLDLTGWRFLNDGILPLNGTWEYYENKLLRPADFDDPTKVQSPTGYFPVPADWSSYRLSNGSTVNQTGYATYRLVITISEQERNFLSLKVPPIYSAYNLWVNNIFVSSCGIVGTNAHLERPWTAYRIVPLTVESNTIEIVCQVSNHNYRQAGLTSALNIGHSSMIYDNQLKIMGRETFIIGWLITLTFFCFTFAFFRPQERSYFIFACFCFLMAIRFSLLSETVFANLISNISWALQIRLEYMTYILGVIVVVFFISAVFPKERIDVINKMVLAFGAISLLLIFFLPVYTISSHLYLLHIFCLIIILMGLIVVWHALKNRREGAFLNFTSLLLLDFLIANDVLSAIKAIDTPPMAMWGIMFFVVLQAIHLARRSSHAFTNLENISGQLFLANNLKNQFLSSVTFNVGRPLQEILSIAKTMMASPPDEDSEREKRKIQENLEMIISRGTRLQNNLAEIIDTAALEDEIFIFECTPLDLRQLVEVCLAIFQLNKQESIPVANEIAADTPLVCTDERRLKQVLLILLEIFENENTARLTFSARGEDNRLSVTVDGELTGKASFNPQWVTDPFAVFEGDTSEELNSRLRLFAARRILEAHGGKLQIIQKQNHLSFQFSLGLAKEDDPPRIAEEGADQQVIKSTELGVTSRKPQGQFTILIAENDLTSLKILMNYLASQEYSVIVVQDGQEVLNFLDDPNYKIDLFILDIVLPKVSGLEICRRIRMQSSQIDAPVLFLIDKDQKDSIYISYEVGGNDYLTKPFEQRELLARIGTMLSVKQLATSRVHDRIVLESEKKQRLLAEKLRKVTTPISATLELNQVMPLLLENMQEIVFYTQGTLLVQTDSGYVYYGTEEGHRTFEVLEDLPDSIAGYFRHLEKDKRPLLILAAGPDLTAGETLTYEPELELEDKTVQTVVVSFVTQGILYGVALINNDQGFSVPSVSLAVTFLEQAGMALENALLFSRTQNLARHDSLTGLCNRRYFMEQAEREIETQKRLHTGLCLLMIDIDFFKRINDTYGHSVGDVVLQDLAARMLRELREVDIVARYGGEEFAVLAPHCEDAGQLAERLRIAMEREPVKGEIDSNAFEVWFTVSIGYACYEDGLQLEELINCADNALFEAKRTGRNKVCKYRAPEKEPE